MLPFPYILSPISYFLCTNKPITLQLMNHLNCFVIEAMAASLAKRIKGSNLADCFSNSADELCLVFDGLVMRCIFHEGTVFFHFSDAAPGKNRLFKPQFNDIKGTPVQDVVIHP